MIQRKQDYKAPTWGKDVVAHIKELKVVIKSLHDLTKTIRNCFFYIMTYFGAPQLMDSFSKRFQ